MKEYISPEIKFINFLSEPITTDDDDDVIGDTSGWDDADL